MEHGSSLGTWIAYGAIVLFLAALAFFLARTMMMTSLLLLQPLRQIWTWLAGSSGAAASPSHAEEAPVEKEP